jgi:protein TonB
MIERREAVRWIVCFVVVVMAHVGAALGLIMHWDSSPAASPPAVMMELAALPVAPASEPTEVPPGVLQTQTEPTPPEPKIEEPTPEVEPEPVKEAALEPIEEIKPEPPVETPPIPDLTPAPKPEVAIEVPPEKTEEKPPEEKKPVEVKKPERKEPEKKKVVRRPTTTTTAPSAAAQAAPQASAPTLASAGNSSAMPDWRSRLVAHLQRHKRYPSEAQSNGHQGTAVLAFTIDRAGRVLSSSLARGSGYASLDQETMALIRRAQPLPAAPAEVRGGTFSFSVPLRYSVR